MRKILSVFFVAVVLSTAMYVTTEPVDARSKRKPKITCSVVRSCQEAYDYLRQGYKDLDRDRDGVPCENICPGG